MTALVASPLAGLRPIGLEELVERAALQTRVDRKYLVPRVDLDAVLDALPAASRVLEERDRRSFGYESVYFDTPDLLGYLSASRRRRRRFKIRTRTYLDSAESFLEVKTRGGRSVTVKDRLPYGYPERHRMTAEGRAYAQSVLADAGIPAPTELDLAPTLTTRYSRSTILLPSESRATVDTGLEFELGGPAGAADPADPAGATGATLGAPELAVVESKSGSTPSEVDRLLWRAGHRPLGISKYGVGLAALRPDLPANKWSRILRRHFAPTDSMNRT